MLKTLFGMLGLLDNFVVTSSPVVLFQGSVGVRTSPKRRTAPTYSFTNTPTAQSFKLTKELIFSSLKILFIHSIY